MELISVSMVAYNNFVEDLAELARQARRLRSSALALGGLLEIMAEKLPKSTDVEEDFHINTGHAALELDTIAQSLESFTEAENAFCSNPWES
jgi:hypothetical protein